MTFPIFCKVKSGIWLLAICLTVLSGIWTVPVSASVSFYPTHDDEVIARVPVIKAAYSVTLNQAIANSQQLMRMGSVKGYAHYYDYAEAQLKPWWGRDIPRVKLLKAHILQYKHQFESALQQLNYLIDRKQLVAEAKLQRAYLYLVMGKLKHARNDCVALLKLVSLPITSTCLAQIRLLQGYGKLAYENLSKIYESKVQLEDVEQYELEYTLTQISCALGDSNLSNIEKWQEKLINNPLVTLEGKQLYFDCLLKSGNYQKLIADIDRDELMHESLLLRKAIALKKLNMDYSELFHDLRRYFSNQVAQNGHYASRDFALYLYHLENDLKQAADVIRRHWRHQKLPVDTELALFLAKKAGDGVALVKIHQWLNSIKDIKRGGHYADIPKDARNINSTF